MIAFILAIISLIAGAFGGIYYIEKFDKDFKTANDFYIEYKNIDFKTANDFYNEYKDFDFEADSNEEMHQLQLELNYYIAQLQQMTQELNQKNDYIEYLESNVEVIHSVKSEAFVTIYNNVLKQETDNLNIFLQDVMSNMLQGDFEIAKNLYINNMPINNLIDLHEQFDIALNDKGLNNENLTDIEFVLLNKYVDLYSQVYDIKEMLISGNTDGLNDMLFGYSIGIYHEFFRYFKNYALV